MIAALLSNTLYLGDQVREGLFQSHEGNKAYIFC